MDGLIRKVVVGLNPKDAMAYFVGMRVTKGEVSAIIQDEKYLFKYSKVRYLIYVENEEGTELWKVIDSMPCILEFDLNF